MQETMYDDDDRCVSLIMEPPLSPVWSESWEQTSIRELGRGAGLNEYHSWDSPQHKILKSPNCKRTESLHKTVTEAFNQSAMAQYDRNDKQINRREETDGGIRECCSVQSFYI